MFNNDHSEEIEKQLQTGRVVPLTKVPKLTSEEQFKNKRREELILTFRISESLIRPNGPFMTESEIIKTLEEHNL